MEKLAKVTGVDKFVYDYYRDITIATQVHTGRRC